METLHNRHLASLTPIKRKKKLEKKRKLENIRRNRRVTLIQAHWRGRMARKNKIYPETNADDLTPKNNNNDDEDHVRERPESDSVQEHPSATVEEHKTLTENREDRNKDKESDGIELNRKQGVVPLKRALSDAERKQSVQENSDKLLIIAEKNEASNEANTIRQSVIAVIMLVAYFGFGMIFYSKTFKISYFRALYFNIITVTTIGYGEISPDTDFTKLITAVNIFAGLAVFTIAITFIMDFLAKEKELLDELLIKKKFEEENKIEMAVKSGADMKDDTEDEDALDDATVMSNMFGEVHHKYNCCARCVPEQIRNAMWNMLMAILTIMVTDLTGAIFFMFVVDDLNFVDAVYFCAVTISSVGYGKNVCDVTCTSSVF